MYSLSFGKCRDIGHRWDYAQWLGNKRVLQCRCGTRKTQHLKGMRVVKSSYSYPKGYNMTKGQLIDMLEDKSGGAEVTVVTPKGELEVIDVREDKIGYVTIVCGEEVG
jgi:hypothetical protein